MRWWEPGGAADAGCSRGWLKGRKRCRAVRRGPAERGETGEGGLATVDRTPIDSWPFQVHL